jgi:hypothetical protein
VRAVTESKTAAWVLGVVAAIAIVLTFLSDADTRPATTIPPNLGGRTALIVDDQLRDLGFANILYSSATGTSATVRPEWTVVSVDGAGMAVDLDTWITVRVR